ncbi:Succinate/fumarate mitochondrial transporter [Seminavis robusta]|uniref:Succinate/fumarate mitochondrial transporter n=1 Tax=Seminavis robusta TaxID=568900 RepID=A0A9N8HU01_9STRA|nr:Succinate/fumarate mitochondrial transporter [Seminavis robusta]|eukprot:Sro1734_g294320.1 Succinate/fumarate mitochondrial transporter (383) ;mRNA; f:21487-22763
MSSTKEQNKKKNPLMHLVAGGCAGLVESSCCHPLDTIKTRMQLRRQATSVEKVVVKMRDSFMEPALRLKHSLQEPAGRFAAAEPGMARMSTTTTAGGRVTQVVRTGGPSTAGTTVAPLGPVGTAKRIIQREGFLALYKGLTAVYTGIVPKMAIRFVSFEQYKEILHTGKERAGLDGKVSPTLITFTAGLMSGLTEAIMVVTPAEVCKIRMQSQHHSMMDPVQKQHRKYTNVVQTAMVITREEGIGALYKGVVPTMLRQGCNQAVNFTGYNLIKKKVMDYQGTTELASWQSLLIGGFSGGMGPTVNNPLDVVKTRMQKQVITPGKPAKYTGLGQACALIAKEEGVLALWKGITPRLLRIVPGQAITFMTYEFVSANLIKFGVF